MKQKLMTPGMLQVGLRIPKPLKVKIVRAAKANGNSFNKELNDRLASSFAEPRKQMQAAE